MTARRVALIAGGAVVSGVLIVGAGFAYWIGAAALEEWRDR